MSYYNHLLAYARRNALFHSVAPTVTQLNHDGFVVQGSISKPGNIYIQTLANGTAAPTSAAVKASPTASITNFSAFRLATTGLSEDTEYDCYVVIEDLVGNISQPLKIDVRTPVNLATVFGANLKTWINTDTASGKTLTSVLNTKASAITGEGTDAISFTTNNLYWNGKNFFFNKDSGFFRTSAANLFNYLHNGSAFTVAFELIFPDIAGSHVYIFNDNNQTPGGTGINVHWQASNSLFARITRGVTVVEAAVGVSFVAGQRYVVILKHTGGTTAGTGTLTIEVNGVDVVSANNTTTYSASNSTSNMHFNRVSTGSTYSAGPQCLGNIVFINKLCNSGELAVLRTRLSYGSRVLGVGPEANHYYAAGQSNMSGVATSPLPPELIPATGAYMWNRTQGLITETETFEPHLVGTNCNTEGQSGPGPDIEFTYRMHQVKPGTIWLTKWSRFGSSMDLQPGGDNDWDTASVVTSDPGYAGTITILPMVIRELKYRFDRTIVWRGFLWRQGESNQGNISYYETKLNDLLARWKTYAQSYGVSTSKVRFISALCDDMGVADLPTTNVGQTKMVAAACNTTHGFKGGHTFSCAGLPKTDGTHFTLPATVIVGDRFADVLSKYINE